MKKLLIILFFILNSCGVYRVKEIYKTNFEVVDSKIQRKFNDGYDYKVLVVYWKECGIISSVWFQQEYPLFDTATYKIGFIEPKEIIR